LGTLASELILQLHPVQQAAASAEIPGNTDDELQLKLLFLRKKMRTIFTFLFAVFCSNQGIAQKDSVEKIFAFKITGYIKSLTDSSTVVQVIKPASLPVYIKEKQSGTLFHCYKKGTLLDTAMIGFGRCQLIKGEYYYFAITHSKIQQAAEGDLLYVLLKLPVLYDGLLLKVMSHAILFSNVYNEPFMNSNAIFTNSQKNELDLLDSMVNDIHFTGGEMLKLMPEQNQVIKGGIYVGKKLFDAMQSVKRSELELFIKYITARPKNYAGSTWKISEIFATWMTSSTPRVVER
jgi:hypothetical protein